MISGCEYSRLLRPHQWAKNLLLFAPILLAQEIFEGSRLVAVIAGVLAMSLISSTVYIVNDIIDRHADRDHPSKKGRPIASGAVSVRAAVGLAFITGGAGFFCALRLVSFPFLHITVLYFVLTLLYSFFVKKVMVLDVLLLTAFYTIRIFAGGVAARVPVSPWLLAFSSFFFLSLAFAKRFVELRQIEPRTVHSLARRGYCNEDISLVMTCGLICGYMSILVFFLYITNSEQVTQLYSDPMKLWFAGPVLLFWITRIWFLAQRNRLNADPVVFAEKDPVSWLCAGCVALVFITGIMH